MIPVYQGMMWYVWRCLTSTIMLTTSSLLNRCDDNGVVSCRTPAFYASYHALIVALALIFILFLSKFPTTKERIQQKRAAS